MSERSLLILVVLLMLPAADAVALRCGQRLVGVGDHHNLVLKKCGSPVTVDSWVEHRVYPRKHHDYSHYFPDDSRHGSIHIDVHIEEWVYNFGRRRFMRVLRFENGRLKKIKRLSYGY